MAIEIVDAARTAVVTGEYASASSISVEYPADLQAGDVLHVAVSLPKYQWEQYLGFGGDGGGLTGDDDGQGGGVYNPPSHNYRLVRQYGIAVPTGWVQAAAYAGPPRSYAAGCLFLLRKVATGLESGSLQIPITQRTYRADVAADGEVIQAAAVMVAHRGVNVRSPYASAPIVKLGWGDVPWNSGDSVISRLVQLGFAINLTRGISSSGGLIPEVGQEVPAWPDPTLTKGQPTSWDVLAEESTEAVEITGVYSPTGAPMGLQTQNIRAAALDASTFTPGLAFTGQAPFVSYGSTTGLRAVFALRDESEGPELDEVPTPGQPGVTGSGWMQPEWVGRDRLIDNPLGCTVWEGGSGPYGDELQLILDEDQALPPVAIEATFNGLGACTSAQAIFPADPGLVPYQHALKFSLRLTTDGSGEGVDWWAGVVRNVRYENGLYVVDADGFWSLLNDARVQLDSSGEIDRPSHPVIEGTLLLGVGDPSAVLIEDEADEQQTWSDHLNNSFRSSPDAAWGIGPDQVFVMGVPAFGGLVDLDALDDDAVVEVRAGDYILPPFVTEWWAEDGEGVVTAAQLTPHPGILVPARLVQSRLDGYGNLIMPKEAMYPIYAGPSHTIEYAGIAVPPIRVINLPNGEWQMVASARVTITLGEEGSMPRITTTLTTVALPYERGGGI